MITISFGGLRGNKNKEYAFKRKCQHLSILSSVPWHEIYSPQIFKCTKHCFWTISTILYSISFPPILSDATKTLFLFISTCPATQVSFSLDWNSLGTYPLSDCEPGSVKDQIMTWISDLPQRCLWEHQGQEVSMLPFMQRSRRPSFCMLLGTVKAKHRHFPNEDVWSSRSVCSFWHSLILKKQHHGVRFRKEAGFWQTIWPHSFIAIFPTACFQGPDAVQFDLGSPGSQWALL